MSEPQRKLRKHLRDQDGVVSRKQALACGLTGKQIDYQVAIGALRPLMLGVYRSDAHDVTPRTNVYAGMLRFDREATMIGASAAWWWELPIERPETIAFTCPRRPQSLPAGMTYRRVYVATEDRIVHDGVPVQSRPLAAIRTAAELEAEKYGTGLTFLDRCIQLGVLREEMIAAILRHRFCSGNRLGRFLLSITEDGAASAAERKAGRLLHEAGITGWTFNVKVRLRNRTVILDICFGDLKIAIEVDGMAFHSDSERFVDDRQRDNDLRSAGWWVIHVTWHDLIADPERFLETVRAAVATRLADFGS